MLVPENRNIILPKNTSHDVLKLYRMAFGSVPYVIPPNVPTPSKGNSYSLPQAPARATAGEYGSEFYATDVIGREFYCPVEITLPPSGSTSEIFSLDYPVIRIEGSASIVSTPMMERKGAVHETISPDDYNITIRGIIINHNGNEIDDGRINRYYDILEAGQSMVLRSVITDRPLHPDYKVIVRKLMMPEFFGVQNVYRYEIECVSDFIFELELA